MDAPSRKKHHTRRRRLRDKEPATAPMPPIADPRSRSRENLETDVAPDLIDVEKLPDDQQDDESICSLPPKES